MVPLALREAVANLYNHTYRQGKTSQYTYENVCIVPGGRSGLSRIAAVIGDVYTVRVDSNTLLWSLLISSFRVFKSPTTLHMIKCSARSSDWCQSQRRLS